MSKKYLTISDREVLPMTLEEVEDCLSKGSDIKFLKIGEDGRLYVCEEEYDIHVDLGWVE